MNKDLNSQLEILDVTIRDGSYKIDFQFNRNDVSSLYSEIERAGFKYIEIGHGLGLNASSVKVQAASSDEEYLSVAAGVRKTSRFGTFFIAGIGDKKHIKSARHDFGMDFIRIGIDGGDIDKSLPYVDYAKSLGYEVMCNFMKSYTISPSELARRANLLTKAGTDVIYIVDSAGGMMPDEVGQYILAVAEVADVRIGFHGHNNLELANANTITAIRNGCTLIDCSIGGLGRSAGNTRTEMMVPILKRLGFNCPYDEMDILRVWKEYILPLYVRRIPSSSAITGGFARIHSELMQPFLDAVDGSQDDLDALLMEYGKDVQLESPPPDVDLKNMILTCKSGERPQPKDSVLLDIEQPHDSCNKIRNTLHSVEETIDAVSSLAKKALLPVVLVADVDSGLSGESYVTSEYLYHDDLFIFVRGFFSSPQQFVDVMQIHGKCFDMVAFNSKNQFSEQYLMTNRDKWLQGQHVFHIDFKGCRHYYLMSQLEQIAREINAQSIFLFASSPSDFVRHRYGKLDDMRFCVLNPKSRKNLSHEVVEIDKDMVVKVSESGSDNVMFDMVLLLSVVDTPELRIVLDRMNSGGIVVDCVGESVRHGLGLTYGNERIIELDMWHALTGEIVNLQKRRYEKI